MPVLYITPDLVAAEVHVPADVAPSAVWLAMAGESGPIAGYLLTPAMYWMTLAMIEQMESRWWKGQVAVEIMTEAWGKWAKIDVWAMEHIGEAALRAECPPFGSKPPRLPRLPATADALSVLDNSGVESDEPAQQSIAPASSPPQAPQPEKIRPESMVSARRKAKKAERPAPRDETPDLFGEVPAADSSHPQHRGTKR